MNAVYDKKVFLRHIRGDLFLRSTWQKRKKELPKDQHDAYLRAMFNSYVGENSAATRAYLITAAIPERVGEERVFEAHGKRFYCKRLALTVYTLTNPLNSPRARFADTAAEIGQDISAAMESGVLPGKAGAP